MDPFNQTQTVSNTPWIVFGEPDAATLAQMQTVAQSAAYVALMADAHVDYVMPIGGVAAYREHVSVTGVGFDIGCGNCAVRLDLQADCLTPQEWEQLADAIAHRISFGVGRTNRSQNAPVDAPLFEDPAWTLVPLRYRDGLRQKARDQLGTVGSGNHYVDVFRDQDGWVWIGVHFGSRGLGHTIASAFLALGQGESWGTRVPEREVLLSTSSALGQDYLELMQLAGTYAYLGRRWVCEEVAALLGEPIRTVVHNHHNFAWREFHHGEALWVVRKGATPAFPEQYGFVGGSMGDDAVILRGVESVTAETAMYSTVHGAGRVMSRTAARGKVKGWGAKARVVSPGAVTPAMMQEWVTSRQVILRGGGVDEAPHVYRRLPDVLAYHANTVEVVATLRPIIVVMAGADTVDPYKD